MKFKKHILFLVLILSIVIIDQWSKVSVANNFYLGESISVIDGFFNLTYVRNSGAAFGFGGQFHDVFRLLLFKVLPVFACFWLLVLWWKSFQGPQVLTWSYSLILGGAIGNIIDRIRLDYVIDFFDFYYGKSHFATFNVADSAISIAAGLLIIDYILTRKKTVKVKD